MTPWTVTISPSRVETPWNVLARTSAMASGVLHTRSTGCAAMPTVCGDPAPVRTPMSRIAEASGTATFWIWMRSGSLSETLAPAMWTVRPSTLTVAPEGSSEMSEGATLGHASGSVNSMSVRRSPEASERAATWSPTVWSWPPRSTSGTKAAVPVPLASESDVVMSTSSRRRRGRPPAPGPVWAYTQRTWTTGWSSTASGSTVVNVSLWPDELLATYSTGPGTSVKAPLAPTRYCRRSTYGRVPVATVPPVHVTRTFCSPAVFSATTAAPRVPSVPVLPKESPSSPSPLTRLPAVRL